MLKQHIKMFSIVHPGPSEVSARGCAVRYCNVSSFVNGPTFRKLKKNSKRQK